MKRNELTDVIETKQGFRVFSSTGALRRKASSSFDKVKSEIWITFTTRSWSRRAEY